MYAGVAKCWQVAYFLVLLLSDPVDGQRHLLLRVVSVGKRVGVMRVHCKPISLA